MWRLETPFKDQYPQPEVFGENGDKSSALLACALACCESVSLGRRNLIALKNEQVPQATGKWETRHLGCADSPTRPLLAGMNEQ